MKRILCMAASVVVPLFVMQGCTTMAPAPVRSIDKTTLNTLINSNSTLEKIVVLPFTGSQTYSKVSGEHFALLLKKHHGIDTIGPATMGDSGLTGAASVQDQARHVKHTVEADAIVFGRVSESLKDGMTVSVTVIDVKTGGMILHTATPGIQQDEQDRADGNAEILRQAVIRSTQSAAFDVISILHRLDGYNWQRPANTDQSASLFTDAR